VLCSTAKSRSDKLELRNRKYFPIGVILVAFSLTIVILWLQDSTRLPKDELARQTNAEDQVVNQNIASVTQSATIQSANVIDSHPTHSTRADIFEPAQHGTAAYLQANDSAAALLLNAHRETIRYEIVSVNWLAISNLFQLAGADQGTFDPPVTVTMFPDRPCTITSYRKSSVPGANSAINATCSEYSGNGYMRISADSMARKLNVRLHLPSSNFQAINLENGLAVIQEFREIYRGSE